MNNATISSDIISFTALKEQDKRKVTAGIKLLFEKLGDKLPEKSFYGRMVQGDYIECALLEPKSVLRVALMIKTFIKSIPIKEKAGLDERFKYYKEHAVRLAVAVAPLTTIDMNEGIIDGEAIYMSGRALKNLSTSDKQKVVIKRTMFFYCPEEEVQNRFDTIFALLDTLLSRCSAKQCEVVFHKLMGQSEKEIAAMLQKNQSTISQHSTAAGWHAIEKTVQYFENTF